MKNNSVDNKTTEKLKLELKLIKALTLFLTGILTLLLVISIYGLLTKENNSTFIALIAVAFSLSMILPLQFITMNKIKTELNNRSKKSDEF